MVSCARKKIVIEGAVGTYHCWSRCVQQMFLCGNDPLTGIDFHYRRQVIEDLLQYQAGVFAIDVGNYNILSNHFHLIARTRPDVADTWSDEEVALRWRLAWPVWVNGQWIREPTDASIQRLLLDQKKLQEVRGNLSSLSWFMARWKEPIAKFCNAEMEKKGHFWDSRFEARALLDDAAVLACSVYVDLNQVKASMVDRVEDSLHSAICNRIRAVREREVAASLENFYKNCTPEQYDLPKPTLDALYADCWLAPICENGPLMTETAVLHLQSEGEWPLRSEAPPEVRVIDEATTDTESSDLETEPDKSEAAGAPRATQQAEDESDPEPSGGEATDGQAAARDSSKSARARHPRRRRASDNPILSMPLDQYVGVVGMVAEFLEHRDKKPEDRSEEPFDPDASVLATVEQHGINGHAWLLLFDELEKTCRHAMGAAKRITERAEQVGQQWMHGVVPCRRVFLDEHT